MQAVGQVGVALGVAVLGVERLVHRQRTLEVPPRLVVRALGREQGAEVIQAVGQVGVALGIAILRVELLANRERFPAPGDGLHEVALLIGLHAGFKQLRSLVFELLALLGRERPRPIGRLARQRRRQRAADRQGDDRQEGGEADRHAPTRCLIAHGEAPEEEQRPKTRLGLPIFTLATDRAPERCVVTVVMRSLRF